MKDRKPSAWNFTSTQCQIGQRGRLAVTAEGDPNDISLVKVLLWAQSRPR